MTAITARYDRFAEDYGRYWAPVLEDAARRLLDRIATPTAASRLLDVGTGTGVLAVEALRRWPRVEVIASDASRGMLEVAERRIRQELGRGRLGPLRLVHADAERLPLEDASVDLVVSSFVFQLVPDRAAAFAEMRRVLRPGGTFAFVTWLDEGESFLPAEEYDEAVLDLEIDEPEEEPEDRAGDFTSPRAAASQLRRAGFRDVRTEAATLEYRWTLDSYLDYKEHYDERALFALLDEGQRDRLRRTARERLSALSPDDFGWRASVVYAAARRPA